MNWFPFALLALFALASLSVVWVGLRRRRLRLSSSARKRLAGQWQHTLSIQDPARRVLEAEKVLDHTLRALGFEGSMADKLQGYQQRFGSIEAVWQAHKLRNRIAHEPGITISETDAKRAVESFGRLLKKFLVY